MKEIIKLSFGSSSDNFDDEIEMNGHKIHVRGIGVDYDFDLALSIVKKYAQECDAFALSGFILDIKQQNKTHVHRMVKAIREAAGDTPV